MAERPTPSSDGRGSAFRPEDLAPRLRWSLRLAAAIRWATVAAIVGLVTLGASAGTFEACSKYDDTFGPVSTTGGALAYGGVAVATVCGALLLVVGRLQPDWRRRVLLLVPVTWVVLVAVWAVAFVTCFSID